MGEVLPILEDFTLRTPGSYLEASDCALTWHYRDADADFGAAQAKNLQLHFDQMLRRRPVRDNFFYDECLCQLHNHVILTLAGSSIYSTSL